MSINLKTIQPTREQMEEDMSINADFDTVLDAGVRDRCAVG